MRLIAAARSGRAPFWKIIANWSRPGFRDKSGPQPLNLLGIGMRLANFTLLIILVMLVAEQGVFQPPPQVLTRDQIIAARKKFELEEKLNTKRHESWDGLALTGHSCI